MPVEQTPGSIGATARALKHIGINLEKSVSRREDDDLGATFAACVVRWWLLTSRLETRRPPILLTQVTTMGYDKPIVAKKRKDIWHARRV